jgi:hypothetical protein
MGDLKIPMSLKRLLIVVMSLSICFSLLQEAFAGTVRGVFGRVVAVEANRMPRTIVIRTKPSSGKEGIVACHIEADTLIKIGQHPATLYQIHKGDRVWLIYRKVEHKPGFLGKNPMNEGVRLTYPGVQTEFIAQVIQKTDTTKQIDRQDS